MSNADKPMGIDHSFIKQRMVSDERLVPSNVALAWALMEDIQETLASAAQPFDIYNETWKLFALYYGARIYGAFGATIAVLFHTFGREASYLDRALYELFTKLLYYTTLHERAREALDGFPRSHVKFMRKLSIEPAKLLSPEQLKVVEGASVYNTDEQFTKMHAELLKDERFKQSAHKPAVKQYLNDPAGQWHLRWVIPSQVVHGTIVDLFASSPIDLDRPEITGELNSERPSPNAALLRAVQDALYTAVHIEGEFGLAQASGRSMIESGLKKALETVDTDDGLANA